MAVGVVLNQLGLLKVETLLHQRVERLEQALLDREGQGHPPRALCFGQFGVAQQFCGRENFRSQAIGAGARQQFLHVQPKTAPVLGAGCHRSGPAGTVSDGTHHRSEEHTSELQSRENVVCRLLLEKKKYTRTGLTTLRARSTPLSAPT